MLLTHPFPIYPAPWRQWNLCRLLTCYLANFSLPPQQSLQKSGGPHPSACFVYPLSFTVCCALVPQVVRTYMSFSQIILCFLLPCLCSCWVLYLVFCFCCCFFLDQMPFLSSSIFLWPLKPCCGVLSETPSWPYPWLNESPLPLWP